MPYWALIPAAANVLTSALRKPTKFTPDMTGYNRAIANLRQRQASNQVYKQAIQPAVRQIGTQAAKARRDIEYDTAREGLTGSGIEAQKKISLTEKILGAYTNVHEQALNRQETANVQAGERVDNLEIQKQAELNRAAQINKQQQDQYKQGIVSSVIGLAGSAAGAFGQQQATEAAQLAKQTATSDLVAGLGDAAAGELDISTIQQGVEAGTTPVQNALPLAREVISTFKTQQNINRQEEITSLKAEKKDAEAAEVTELNQRYTELSEPQEFLNAFRDRKFTSRGAEERTQLFNQLQRNKRAETALAERLARRNETPTATQNRINAHRDKLVVGYKNLKNKMLSNTKLYGGDDKIVNAMVALVESKGAKGNVNYQITENTVNELYKKADKLVESYDFRTVREKYFGEMIGEDSPVLELSKKDQSNIKARMRNELYSIIKNLNESTRIINYDALYGETPYEDPFSGTGY